MDSAYDLYTRGMRLLEDGDCHAAAVSLQQARDLEPDKTSVREALGRAFFGARRWRDAQREFEAAHPGPGLPSVSRPASTALPPKASAAREPMKRLADAEKALAQVLAQLAAPPSAVPPESVDQARATSAEAANALRAVAAQMVAVELARDHAPPLERAPLIEGVARLRDQLDEGLDGYRSLVAAAGRVVAASSSPGPKQELTEATDHLAGLAVALRELSDAAG